MDILEESSGNLFEPSSLYNTDCCHSEMVKMNEVEEIVRYIERDTSVRNLIEHHSLSDSHVSSEEFLRPINDNDDIEVSLASLQLNMSYMRKVQGEYVPFNIFLQDSRKQSDDKSTINNCLQNPVINPHELPFPVYISSLFYQTLSRPLTYIEFMKLTFSTLSHLYKKTKTNLHGILESILEHILPAQHEDRFLLSIEEATTIETRLSKDFQEFFENCSRCENLRRHFVDVIIDDLPLGFESFKRERLVWNYLEYLLGNSEYLANQIISLLYEYSEKKHELSLYSKITVTSQNDA